MKRTTRGQGLHCETGRGERGAAETCNPGGGGLATVCSRAYPTNRALASGRVGHGEDAVHEDGL
jgi:hypothetical protein